MKIKNVQSIIILVIFSLFANLSWAADWIYFDTAEVGDVYYDKSSIKKVSENIISVLNKDVLSEKAKKKYFSLLKEIHKAPKNPSMLNYYIKVMEIDCLNKKIKDISVIFYNAKGKVIYSSPKSDSGEWNDVLPNTVGEKLINAVSCESVVAKVEEPVTPVADAKVKEPDGSNVTVTAAPAETTAPAAIAATVTAPVAAAAAPVETATPVVTAEPPPAAASVETATPTAAPEPVPIAAPVEAVAPVVTAEPPPAAASVETAAPTAAPEPVPTAAPVEAVAPAAVPPPVETAAPAAAAASVETAIPAPNTAPVETVPTITVPEPAVADNNLDQVDNKQIETKSASEEAVRNLLTKWLNSWKSGDMKTYRSCYESNFKSEVTYTNASVSYKTNVRQKSKKINISVDKLQISADENKATAVFTQNYSSSILKYSGKKKLELRKTDDGWKIYREIM